MIDSPVHEMTSKDDVMISVHVDCLVYDYREVVRNITDIRDNVLFDSGLMALTKFYQGAKVLRPLAVSHFLIINKSEFKFLKLFSEDLLHHKYSCSTTVYDDALSLTITT